MFEVLIVYLIVGCVIAIACELQARKTKVKNWGWLAALCLVFLWPGFFYVAFRDRN